MRGEGGRSLERIAVFVVKTPFAWSKNSGGNEGSDSTCHVNDAAPSEVNYSDVLEGVITECSQETVGTPYGMDDNGVHKSRKEE